MLWAEVWISVLIICKFSNKWTCTRKKEVEGLSCGFEGTDIESELSDATNANNHVKFKWKPLRKQVPFTVPRLHNIFNQVYNNTFD